ncbi:PAS domain-containing protein [Maribacter spongiicola]|uniref:histidine kinase n=1 Tax=Maribacter spongiicola TaxID=1206753 RepID=A0A4R7K8A8_9FLAO|nr:ATP-binding protein [Maribacter spongiicola]TDT47179.1 PAS domain-containing protein [Maribacter spongiicola]
MASLFSRETMMKLKSFIGSTKTYVILLVLAIALLLYTVSVGYKQVNRLHKTGDLVSHTLEVQHTIVELSSKFLEVEAIQLRKLFGAEESNLSVIVVTEMGQSLDRLNTLTTDNDAQQERVKALQLLRDKIKVEIDTTAIDDDTKAPDSIQVKDSIVINYNGLRYKRHQRISKIVAESQIIKDRMLAEENYLMVSRKEEYTSQSFLTPMSSLLVALTALGIFLIGFISIYKQKGEIQEVNSQVFIQNKKLQETEEFLKGVYKSSNNVISHFEPILDAHKNIVDFQFRYTSNAIEKVTGSEQDDIIGSSLLEMYPMVLENGLFALMKECYVSGDIQEHESVYTFEGEKKYIFNTIVKSANGITNTAWDTTKVKEAEKNLQKLNDNLSLQNTIFKEAENVAGVGSFIWYLDDGTATVSDNFYRILGVEPNSFEVTFNSYKEFVYPDDVAIFESLSTNDIEKGASTVFAYRVQTIEKGVKHLDLKGKYVEIDNRPVSVGIVQDITARVEKDRALIDSYEKLKHSNEELESFNRVASHDLQEPLRKIQMFISRIEDEGEKSMPASIQNYFGKIKSGTFRMRELIQNLLSYSRIDKINSEFERISLNETVLKIEDELSQLIKETNTSISYKNLPIIQGIPFKIEQLCTNLISNSIKYGKSDVAPKIIISSKKVRNSEIRENFSKNSEYYYKISFIDNGIGFEPEFASNIFEVFQRLHSKNEYSGTGIGLSICKKIVEKHYGYIHAIGKKGEGSTFVIYLPVN